MKPTKILLMAFAFTAGASMLIAFSSKGPHAAGPGPKDQMIADWERAKAYTQEYINAATDEVIGFKPTPEMRTFGQQMLHLSEANYGLGAAASGKPSPVTWGQLEKNPDQYKTKEALSKAVMDSYDFVIASLKATDEAKMGDMVKVFNFDLSRALT
ncbi:MAG: DinB family protein, partial [Bacteroidota bacterium]